jgi:AraC family transcriptional regulator of adaptative response / DNA-3-methyladenine glycosylase II
MTLDPDTCYRAFASRDRRFEGRFVTAVVTTGIYCRPGCPARLPRRRNMKFFACAAAAEEAGFRPCLRCRPDGVPGSPAWSGTSATVNRALRLIDDGALDEAGVDRLADRLGVTDRHLRRLFEEHLGASPHAVARTRRAHFARRLIDETRLPFGEIALSAGFANVRRFNQAMRETFGRSPRELRGLAPSSRAARAARHRGSHAHDEASVRDGALQLALRAREPFDGGAVLAFLAPRAVPGLECVERGSYHRAIEADGASTVLSVTPSAGALHVSLGRPAPRDLIAIASCVARVFDLNADAPQILAHLRRDPLLARALAGRRDLRVPGAWHPFELAVRAILGQQVSVRGAATLAARIVQSFGQPLAVPLHGVTHAFPTPQRLAHADLGAVGLTRARAASLTALARAVADGRLDFAQLGDLEQAVPELMRLPGIGAWTAQYIAMRALGEPDAFPAGDLGLLRAMESGSGRARRTTSVQRATRDLEQRSQAWRPWRAYAVVALWTQDHSNTGGST